MRENDEFIGQVEDYLVEFDGDTPLPGRVADAIHAELPRTRQAKAGPGFMRMPPMLSTLPSRAPLGIAAAAVVIAVVLGAVFINRDNNQSGVGGVPAASPTPESSQSLTTLLAEAPGAPCPGITDEPMCLEPGIYQVGGIDVWPAIITIDVPENWWYYANGTGSTGVLVQTNDVTNGSGWGVLFNTVSSLANDPCDPTAGRFETHDHTPGELYEVMAAWPDFQASGARPITINGYKGVSFALTGGVTEAHCANTNMWTTANGASLDAYPFVSDEGRPYQVGFRIFDIDGEPLIVMAMDFPQSSPWETGMGHPFDANAHAVHQVEMDAILDSIELKDPEGGAN